MLVSSRSQSCTPSNPIHHSSRAFRLQEIGHDVIKFYSFVVVHLVEKSVCCAYIKYIINVMQCKQFEAWKTKKSSAAALTQFHVWSGPVQFAYVDEEVFSFTIVSLSPSSPPVVWSRWAVWPCTIRFLLANSWYQFIYMLCRGLGSNFDSEVFFMLLFFASPDHFYSLLQCPVRGMSNETGELSSIFTSQSLSLLASIMQPISLIYKENK